jgi:tripartite-type tricarboxylate transporter receptor subunit TctC
MRIPRRQFLQLGATAIAAAARSQLAWAQAYPARPVRIIVGFPAGGLTDITARLIAQWLSDRLGQPFIVENRPGAVTNIATEAVVQAPADGYTLLLVTALNAINATVYDKLNFNFIRDIAPVASIVNAAFVASSIQYIRAGTLRALAVTTATRSQALPDVPSMAEFLPGF